MLQVIDTSASILLSEEKANSHMLEMINACISHELRNPLNSIIAQSMENGDLYQEMKDIVAVAHPNALQLIDGKLDQLVESAKIEEASASVMKFLVQDFLDYAQIKSDKFRKNITQFDIRTVVDKVMSIQMRQASLSGVVLQAKFTGFGEDGRSSLINADEGRIVQILLNL